MEKKSINKNMINLKDVFEFLRIFQRDFGVKSVVSLKSLCCEQRHLSEYSVIRWYVYDMIGLTDTNRVLR